MHATILIADGVGVRNFLLSSFIHDIAKYGEVTVLHRIPESELAKYQSEYDDRVHWERCSAFKDGASTFFFRRSLSHAHLCYGDTTAMRYNRYKPFGGRWHKRVVIHAANAYGQLSASRKGIQKLIQRHDRSVEKLPEFQQYVDQFSKSRPDVIFCTHQRSLEAVPPMLAAKSLGIPTATFIFSWDNLSSKGRFAAHFDHFFVWSELMRDDLLKYYPDVTEDRIHIVGTPQFDPYANETLIWSREEFCQKSDLDPNRPIICFSGGDNRTTPEDQFHLKILLDQIRSGQIQGNPQVLMRPSPADQSNRFEKLRTDYPEMRYCEPQWIQPQHEDWSSIVPTAEDIQFLANLVRHADLNVNVSSTMTMDFAIHDKPVVNIAFDVADPPPFGVPLIDFYYRYEHYKVVVELGAARIATSPDSFAEHINEYLRDPSLDREARRRFVELEIDLPVGNACKKVIDALHSIAAK